MMGQKSGLDSKNKNKMYKNIKNYPMLGSEFALGNIRRKEESATFKGTLIGILVSFLIIIFCAFLLNLAESYYNGGATAAGIRQQSHLKL